MAIALARLHVAVRELLRLPVSSPEWREPKAGLQRCAEVRRMMIEEGWFN